MLVRDLSVQNPKVKFESLNFDFSEYGINIIRGENGIGKTTILEHIIFGTYDAIFSSKEQQECFANGRHNLFAYVPQNIPVCKVSVLNFLTKGNQDISLQNIEAYMKELGLSNIPLDERFDRLSGGEKVKLSIISALLKNTPYIFMDEPTNHLDDTSIQILENIIQRKSSECTFIIVCHDMRFEPKAYNLILIDTNKIKEVTKTKIPSSKNMHKCKQIKKAYKKLVTGILFNSINLIVLYAFIALIAFLITFNAVEFQRGYSHYDITYDSNIIVCYLCEGIYSKTNMVYVRAKNLNIQEDNYQRLITYADIEGIFNIDGVERIIIIDTSMLKELYLQESKPGEPISLSLPYDFLKNFIDIYFETELFALFNGNYPRDNTNEIALSRYTITNYFMLNIDEAVNQTIEFHDRNYVISGILNSNQNLALKSHLSANQSIFYEFNENTFRDYINSKGIHDEQSCDIYIYTTPGKEENVLNQILTAFPAHNYSSFEFALSWQKQYNKDFLRYNIVPVNFLLAFCLSIVVFLIRKHQIILDQSMLVDFRNYYIDGASPVKVYVIVYALILVSISLSAVIANYFYCPFAYASAGILILDMLIAFSPSFLYSLWRIRRHVY